MFKIFLSILPHLFIHFHHNTRLVCRPCERIAMLSFLNILKRGTKTMSRKMKQNMNFTNKVWANHVYNNYNYIFHLIFFLSTFDIVLILWSYFLHLVCFFTLPCKQQCNLITHNDPLLHKLRLENLHKRVNLC